MIGRDITESRREFKLLREIELAANIGGWEVDIPTKAIFWSRQTRVIHELPDDVPSPKYEEALGYYTPDSQVTLIAALDIAIAQGTPFQLQLQLITHTGRRIWVQAWGRAEYHDGKPLRLCGAFQDISLQKQTENTLQRLWNLSIEPMCVAGFDGYFQQVNPGFTKTLGLSEHELRSHPWLHFTHPEDRESTIEASKLLFMGNSVQEFVNRYRHADGTYRWFSWNALADRNDQRIYAIVRDVTEHKELEAQLLHSQKMDAVGRLAGGIAHDFNNLLTIITGSADLMLELISVGTPVRGHIENIKAASERATQLTAQLLAFGRRAIVRPVVVDVNDVVRQAIRLVRPLIAEDIHVELQLGDRGCGIHIDPGQLDQVIVNLVVNARDAMPSGGRLTFTTRIREPNDAAEITSAHVELSVSDTGTGMSEAVRSRAFEPFFTTKPFGQGTGLGLSTVYGIVTAAGGTIRFDDAPGGGTSVVLRFPAIETPPAGPPAVLEESSTWKRETSGQAETILLVEDEDGVRQLGRLILEQAGYTVIEATDATDAIELAADETVLIHLLVTDVVMPSVSGRELAETLRQSRPELRVLYVSGYTEDDVITRGVDSNSEAFLQKPFSRLSLLTKVRAMLDTPAE